MTCLVPLATAQTPAFEVASIKAVDTGGAIEARPTRTPGRFTWTTDLSYLVSYAWNVPLNRVSSLQKSVTSPVWRIEATTKVSATEDETRLMLRALLEDRVHMVAHISNKDADGYDLSIAKAGLKIKEYKDADPPAPIARMVTRSR